MKAIQEYPATLPALLPEDELGSKASALLVAPRCETRRSLEEALQDEGFEVHCVSSLGEVRLITLGQGSLVVLLAEPSPATMKDLRNLRARYPSGSYEICVVCGSEDTEGLRELMKAGADDLISTSREVISLRLRLRMARLRLTRCQRSQLTPAEEALPARRQRAQLSWAMQQVPSLLWATDRRLQLTSMLGAGVSTFTAAPGQEISGTIYDLFDVKDPDFPPIRAALRALEGEPATFEFEWLSRTFEARVEPLTDQRRQIVGCMGIALDISERRNAEQALSLQEAYFQQLFESSPQAIVILDMEDRILQANQGFEDLFGYRAEEVSGRTINEVIVPQETCNEANSLSKAVLCGEVVRLETVRRHRNGNSISVSVLGYPILHRDRIIGVYGIYNDITDRKSFEKQLRHDALHDSLTNLPNRALFLDRLKHCLGHAKRRPKALFAVLFLDLDRFKVINDSLGHGLGDQLLIALAERLVAALRPSDTVARLGGDEFVIMLEEIQGLADAVRVAERIRGVLTDPFELAGHEVFTTASIGIALSSPSYRSPEELIRDADTAMYQAKAQGRACHTIFNQEMHAVALQRLHLETDLRRAQDRGEFCVHYQPIVSLRSGRISGFEALLRWLHPQRGMLAPDSFLAVAEETGITVDLSSFVLHEVCTQLSYWQERHPLVGISVNLSTKQFLQPNLVAQLDALLLDFALPSDVLRLEITEGVILDSSETVEQTLGALKARNLSLYLDDFGTGYSSLSYLQSFPIDTLKIDRSFISGRSGRGGKPEIVRAIVGLAHSLGIDVVAEGVERPEQLAALRALGCEHGQGFLFSKPLPREKATELLDRNPSW